MKYINKYILLLFSLVLITSCSNTLDEKVKFDVDALVDDVVVETVVVKKNQPVKFQFDGNSDFITFYSGEDGHDYDLKDKNEFNIEDISARLEFKAVAQYGDPLDIMKVFLSTKFPGLDKKNKDVDFTNLNNKENWIDITDQCKLPKKANWENNEPVELTSISLDEYIDENVTIAFLYNPFNPKAVQSVYEIQDLKIITTNKKTGVESEIGASTMAFVPFDIQEYHKEDGKPYKVAQKPGEGGTWYLNKLSEASSALRMPSSKAPEDGVSFNEDWLISNPQKMNTRITDKGVSLKTVHTAVSEYTYVYENTGEYNVAFVATNANFDHHSRVIKRIKITVTE